MACFKFRQFSFEGIIDDGRLIKEKRKCVESKASTITSAPLLSVLTDWTPPGGVLRDKFGWECAACFLKPLPYLKPKSVIFPTLFHSNFFL